MKHETQIMQKRVTLRFHSDQGHEYLYDDITGCIFPWNELREVVLVLDLSNTYQEKYEELTPKYGARDIQATFRLIRRWRENYNAFVRTWSESDWSPCPPADQLGELIRNLSFELLLILTENCNLRCKYCALSETYPLNRLRSTRRMSIETAKRAVDWYVKLVQPQMAGNPRKRFGLSFYGGEPMMNMPVLKGVLEYCCNKYPGKFLPVITTNGTLLTPKNVKVLVEHGVMLAISIDGPEKEHDRLRIDVHGRGTFAKIAENLQRLKEDYPEYWAAKVTSVSVYDWGTDLEAVENFFNENGDRMPRSVFVNQVGPRNTSWYAQYKSSDRDRMMEAMGHLREQYKRAKIEGNSTSHYMNSLVGTDISMALLRPRAHDIRPNFIPFSGACVPGNKLAVHVDGKIDMCERVNSTYPIGQLDSGGIDYERLRQIIERYQSQVLSVCPNCPATKHCSLCFALVEGQADFSKVPELCAGIVEGARKRLSDYVSILEKNPKADFKFETDTSHLEDRLLINF